MKKLFFSLITLFLLAACGTREKEISGPVLFDATRDYPEKQLLLDEVADITYVPLSSETDSALFRGTLTHVSERTITIHDFQRGIFYLFDRSGRYLSSFNHKGQGPEDYNFLVTAFVDEASGELFAVEKNWIQVYDLKGDYRRTLRLPDGAWVYEAADGGDGSILLVDNQERASILYAGMVDENAEAYEQPFVRISKADGGLVSYITLPKNFLIDLSADLQSSGISLKVFGPNHRLVSHRDGFLLTNQETDTIFLYAHDQLRPMMIHTPPVSEQGEKSYLNGYVEAGDYLFFEKVLVKAVENRRPPVPSAYYLYDKRDGQFYEQAVGMRDFEGKRIDLTPQIIRPSRDARLGCLLLTVDELQTANADGKLSGELKRIVDEMPEDSNDLLMLMRFK
ncbi:MAG TPA: 6-bladed beta-propeller [Candidatus Parabacteroides intestinipullorum]|uniref:6-bladed beta-propeller n=1 Tax=Candidatus Parabacteroides intestinipullorum TaxID=2838723 RepID=A0A9D2BH06_9BACT|nr:6-bladed beta-propeller [Candidatus Parabacteroides intestinipullorum]